MPDAPEKPSSRPHPDDAEMLGALQRVTFDNFLRECNHENGLVADSNQPGSPASIATTGLAISIYIAAARRNVLSRAAAAAKVLKILRFLHSSAQGPQPDASGYKGFYYHFLDMNSGRRSGNCELSTIDTAILMAGVLNASAWFTHETLRECEIRQLADSLLCAR